MLRLFCCLSLLLFGSRLTNTFKTGANCVCDADNATQTSVFDEAILQKLEQQLELLKASKQVLHVRIDELDERLEHQRNLLNELREKVRDVDGQQNDRILFPTTPRIDVRDIFDIPAKDKENYVDHCSGRERLPHSCAEATANSRKTGLYTILDDLAGSTPFWVACDEDMHGGAWTVIQRRIDGSVEFYRNWTEYRQGFGKIDGEYWIGLDRLHALTTRSPQELLIVMEDFDNVRRFAKYTEFAIGDESEAYTLKVLGEYSGDAGDSLTAHSSYKFSTMDRDNDNDHTHCAQVYLGAWWYNKCHVSNLNGKYLRGAYSQDQFAKGVVWHTFRGYNYALKFVQMMVRPKRT